MKKALLFLLLVGGAIFESKAADPSRCYFAGFEMLSFVNKEFRARVIMYFNLGGGGSGPKWVGLSARQSHDTLFLGVFHELVGAYQTFHSTSIDTVVYKDVDDGISFVNVSYNEVQHHLLPGQQPDTLLNVHDSTFRIRPAGVGKAARAGAFSVFPNPAVNGKISLRLDLPQPPASLRVRVTNAVGQLIQRQELTAAGRSGLWSLDLTEAPKGVYSVELIADGERIVRQVVLR